MKRNIQIALAIAIAVAAIRAGWILYTRHETNKSTQNGKQNTAPPLNADYYVTPKKLHAYDLKSARELTKQPVWVKEGYRYTYYMHNAATHKTDFAHEAGLLLPLQKIDFKDVVVESAPSKGKQVMAVFNNEGKDYAVPVGTVQGTDFKLYADEMLFIEDPKTLYKHWPSDVWESIDKHEVKPGMSELQTDFAIGMGVPQGSEGSDVKTVNYPNGGKPLTITYQNGKALDVKPGAPAS